MKKLLAPLLAFFTLLMFHPFALAANSATAQTAMPIRVGGVGPVVPYVVAFDTTATDLTIVTPASDKMACIVGWLASETSATNVTITSASTANVALELAANQGIYDKIQNGVVYCTQPGEALKIQVSTAVSSMFLYVIQARWLDFGGK